MMDDLEKNMLAWAAEAAEMALGFYRRTGDLQFKQGREAVTEADRQIETMLRLRIGEAYPEDEIIGEEFGGQGSAGSGRRVWQIDPIDGTLNFALGLPGFCTSMALMSGDEILAACVHQPLVGDSFTAVKGQGARLNGQSITVSDRSPLAEAVISTQFKKSGRFMRNADLLQAITLAPLKCRRVGAIALELAWVASGGYDGLVGGFSGSIHLWDVAAGLLLVTEAGGMITDHLGRPYQAGGADLVVSNGLVHQEILDIIAAYRGKD
jgi:myo-inositol-1(or 4)-monophosphatase